MVGIETTDSTSVYRLSSEIASINTVSCMRQPLADPYWFGQIAAANALGKIYAFGGRPVTALNLIMSPGEQQNKGTLLEILKLAFFPSKQLDKGMLKEILRGGYDKVTEVGACLTGGQFMQEAEPQYGLCVNGVVHPEQVITHAGALPGDALILTKPLGAGVLLQAVRTGKYSMKNLENETLPLLVYLHDKVIEAAGSFDIHACSDVSNSGIIGCLLNIARGAQARVVLKYQDLLFYSGAIEMSRKGVTTESNKANRALLSQHDLKIRANLSEAEAELLYDPQVAGGLLLTLPRDQAPALLTALQKNGVEGAACIGEAVAGAVGVRVE
ncbi:MAG: selenide, water dikinase SelD [Candidatus Electrothrix aestuarii]|uniref:Selenide, water dikinase SelD n=1 Tax=Candidatus Electrothrix aestuarii TaxID=3062594 RepID=A0AAU8LTV0_9BACT